MASLKLNHIYKVYPGGVKAVNDFCMDIEDKEFIVFVGPSGCGKSTTLRMIAGLEEITAGELYIGDQLVNDMEPKDRDIAMVFQNYALYPHMTVYDNMAFGLKLRRLPKEEIQRKVTEAAEILGITEYLQRKPKELSGGQRQRVALGRAIVREPKVFLLDEPLSNLDAKLRTAMRSEISKLHHKLQTTFIYVTHDQVEAMTMGTRIVVMKDGFVQQIDTPRNLYRFPANKFVAGFIGTPQMNFFDGRLTLKGDKVNVKFDNTEVDLDVPERFFNKADRKYLNGEERVVMGIRAEHISDDPNHYPYKTRCRVTHLEELGTECQIFADLNLDNEDVVGETPTRIIIKALAGTEYEIGSVIEISMGLEHLRVFDAQTEVNIAPRIPEKIVLDGEVKKGVLHVVDSDMALPSAIAATDGAYKVSVPIKAISFGGSIKAVPVEEENVNGTRLIHLQCADRMLFAIATDEQIQIGKTIGIAIDCKLISFEQNGECVIKELSTENELTAKLQREKQSVEKEVNGKTKVVKEFAYYLDICNYRFACPETIYQRVLASDHKAPGKPLNLKFDPYSAKLADEGIGATVASVADYGTEKFAVCNVEVEQAVLNPQKGQPKTETVTKTINVAVPADFDKTEVKIVLDLDAVSVFDPENDIRLA